jgi:hypothetical protein
MDSTTLRERVLITAVELAEELGAGHYHDVQLVIIRGKFDPLKAREALAYWLRYRRDGASETVLRPFSSGRLDSFAISDESRRMVDQLRSRHQGPTTTIGSAGAVHSGVGDINIHLSPSMPAADSATSFRADALAVRLQEHVEECFDALDTQGMAVGPYLRVNTRASSKEGFVGFVRLERGRFIEDPNGRDGIRVIGLDGRRDYIPLADLVEFTEVD